MAATDARPVPRKNVAYRYYFAVRKPSDGTLITTWAGADSEVSLDGASFSDCTNEATEIGTTGCGYIDLTSSEMNADCVLLKITVTNTGAVPLVFTLFPEEVGDYRANVEQFGGTAGTFSSGRPEVNATHWGGTAVASANVLIDGAITAAKIATGAIDADAIAADAVTEIQSGLSTFNHTTDTVLVTNLTVNSGATLATGTHSPQSGDAYSVVNNGTHGNAALKTMVDAKASQASVDVIDGIVDAILVDTAEIGAAGAGLTEAGGTGDHLTALPWNVSWDAEVQSEVQDAIEANHLDHLLATTYDPASKPGAADALLNEMIGNDGGVSQFTANALELAPSGGGGGATISVVVPAAVAAASQSTNAITAVRGDTLRRSFTDLGNVSTRTKLWFTVKAKTSDADSAAIIQITEAGGLLTFNGAATANSALGSITVDDAADGDITVYIDESITKEFGLYHGYVFDVQWLGATDVTTPLSGTFTVTADVTKAVA